MEKHLHTFHQINLKDVLSVGIILEPVLSEPESDESDLESTEPKSNQLIRMSTKTKEIEKRRINTEIITKTVNPTSTLGKNPRKKRKKKRLIKPISNQ